MKTRSTILAVAALATLSLSALAPTQALAWGHGWGHHYGHGWGHHYGYGHRWYGHRWGYYGHRFYRWSGYRSYGSYGGGYSYGQPSYGSYEPEAPAPIIKRVYVPVEVPVEVPVPVRVPVREQACGCETAYVPPPPPPPVDDCNCEGPVRTYAPARPPMREGFMPRRRAQDSQDVAQTELEK